MIVRLMNSSLTPNDQLGRMLHTFNTTATEIDKIDYSSLIAHGLLNIKQTMVRKAKQKTILINKNTNNLLKSYSNQIIGFTCLDFRPTEKIKIKYNNTEADTIIEIGITGQYKAEFNKPIYSLEVFDSNTQGQIDILYYDNSASSFDNILSISEENITLKQLKLDDNHALGLISTIETPREGSITQIFNFTKEKDIEFEVQNYPFIRFVKRDDIQNVPYGVIINNETNIDLDKIGVYKIVGIDQNYIPEISFDKGVMVEISVERYKIEREEEE